MSTETHVFFRGKLPTRAALSRALKELAFPFSIKPATGSLEQQSGFMPMMLRREETGVEFDVYDDHFAVEEFADAGVDQSLERRASLRWGGDFQEAVAGMCAAAALAKVMDGVVFDEAENRLLSADEAVEVARKNLKELPEPPKQRTPRGPATLERMMAPLLAKRSDLVLAGHLLLIRPVRHLIRGAVFQWSNSGMECTARPYLRPLYQPGQLFQTDAVLSMDMRHPDFAPMLFDRLAVEVFEPLGKIASIEDFIESSWGKRLWQVELFYSILLSQGLDQAKTVAATLHEGSKRDLAECKARLAVVDRKDAMAMYFRKRELKSAEENIPISKERLAFLARGEAAVFEHYRALEANVARGHKIEHAWEPAPFPAQLPASQRAAKSADPKFTPTPWLDLPSTWRQDPPETPGEIRFAGHWWYRQGRPELLHPITREQAGACHGNLEHYVLAARLPEGQVLILIRTASGKGGPLPPLMCYHLWIYGARGRHLLAAFDETRNHPGLVTMRSIDIRGGKSWHSSLNFEDDEKTTSDSRLDSFTRQTMTKEDRSTYIFSPPPFGDFDIFWQRISMYLEQEGYGTFQ
jgi:hypothetical protein